MLIEQLKGLPTSALMDIAQDAMKRANESCHAESTFHEETKVAFICLSEIITRTEVV